nr:vesicular GABA transporter [Cucujiformia]
TSQIFLPTLEGNMVDPSKFQWMLDWSHIWAAIFKALFGYICFLTFQNDTQQVITNNLPSAGFKALVNFCLVVKALLSYPLPYYAACELLERAFFRGKPKTPFPTIWDTDGELKVWGLAWRVGVVTFTILMACFIPHFSTLMGFIGTLT